MTDDINIYILSLFHPKNKQRSSSVYQILRGKKTASTLSFCLFHHLWSGFQLFPYLSVEAYEQRLAELKAKGYLVADEADGKYLLLSQAGQACLLEHPFWVAFSKEVDHFSYGVAGPLFLERLLFLSQVISELSYQSKQYEPITSEEEQLFWVKQWLAKTKVSKEGLISNFYTEWQKLLEQLADSQRQRLVSLLTGHHKIGTTYYQLQQMYHWSEFQRIAYKIYDCQQIIHLIKTSEDFPLFASVLASIPKQTISKSAQLTYNYVEQGLDSVSIQRLRQIKPSTVQDHLIEAAVLLDDFSFDACLDKQVVLQLETYEKKQPQIIEWQFKQVQGFDESISFLEVRLYQILKVKQYDRENFRPTS